MINKKEKKEKKEKKKKKKVLFRIFIAMIGVLVLFTTIFILNETNPSSMENKKIVANKKEQFNGENIEIKYEIIIKGYDLKSAIKTIKYKSKNTAQSEYEDYEFKNKYERRNIGLELKGKTLILTMPEDQFKEDIGYNDKKNITLLLDEGESKKVISQDAIKEALQQQGYVFK